MDRRLPLATGCVSDCRDSAPWHSSGPLDHFGRLRVATIHFLVCRNMRLQPHPISYDRYHAFTGWRALLQRVGERHPASKIVRSSKRDLITNNRPTLSKPITVRSTLAGGTNMIWTHGAKEDGGAASITSRGAVRLSIPQSNWSSAVQ